MGSKNLTKILSSALMAAFCCVATMLIAIPTPTGGYVHPGINVLKNKASHYIFRQKKPLSIDFQ